MKSILIKNMMEDLGDNATTDVPIPNVSLPRAGPFYINLKVLGQ